LLGIGASSLKIFPDGASVHQNVAGYHTNSLSARQYIEEGGLIRTVSDASRLRIFTDFTSARSTHESCESPGLDVSVDIGQELPLTTRN